MKLTQDLIDQIQQAMNHTKKNGDINWEDGDEIKVQLAGTFAADKFIVIRMSLRVAHHFIILRVNETYII